MTVVLDDKRLAPGLAFICAAATIPAKQMRFPRRGTHGVVGEEDIGRGNTVLDEHTTVSSFYRRAGFEEFDHRTPGATIVRAAGDHDVGRIVVATLQPALCDDEHGARLGDNHSG